MKAFCITLPGHPYSERVTARCIASARDVGKIHVERFTGVPKTMALEVMQNLGLRWTWGNGGAGLKHHSYGGPLETRVGCAMSHYRLWMHCVDLEEPILILEHDAVFVREFPEFDFQGACQINDPWGATKRGQWWSQQMQERGIEGVLPKTKVLPDDVPDGLAGNSAYVIKPFAAQALINKVREIGVWPNDATMCRQFFPWLEELYPFVTRVEQEQSTTNG